jgi:hypothetical protein
MGSLSRPSSQSACCLWFAPAVVTGASSVMISGRTSPTRPPIGPRHVVPTGAGGSPPGSFSGSADASARWCGAIVPGLARRVDGGAASPGAGIRWTKRP